MPSTRPLVDEAGRVVVCTLNTQDLHRYRTSDAYADDVTSHRTDRILPLIVPIGVWAFIGALIFFLREIEKLVGLYLLWVPLLTVLLGGALVLNLLALIVGAVSRCWRHCAYLVVAPLGIFAVFSSLPLIGVTPEKVRFVVSEPYLAWRIGRNLTARGRE